MKTIQLLAAFFILAITATTQAQTAEEIVTNYIENTGGEEAWNNLKTLKIVASVNQNGVDIPVVIMNTKDGKQKITANFQGQEIVQLAFDGETAWATNFQAGKAEKLDSEATENFKKINAKIFPTPFLNYKERGHKIELLGEEIIDGTNTYKIKITMDPVIVEGQEVDNVETYYFETENFVPIQSEVEQQQGPQKGQIATDTYSDYEEVDGLYFAFARTVFGGQPIEIKTIEVNPEISDDQFAFPKQ